ncbi:hypothetical protein D3C85_1128830 [compost metagenome]
MAQVGERREQGEVPGRVVEGAGLGQVGDFAFGLTRRPAGGEADGFQAFAQHLAGAWLPFVQGPPVVLQAAGQALLVFGG